MLQRPQPRLDDGAIAGTTTQVAGQGIGQSGAVRPLFRLIQGIKRHDEAGRTEAALRAMLIHHRLLHRMQLGTVGLETLHREEFLTVQRWQELDACIDRVKL